MQQTMITISALCMTAALCGQLIHKSRFHNAVRLLLGLEIACAMLSLIQKLSAGMLKWS